MRQPSRHLTIAVILTALLALPGCNWLAAKSGKLRTVEQVQPDHHFHDSQAVKSRFALEEQLGLAVNRLGSGDLDDAEKYANKALTLDANSVQAHTLLAVIADRRDAHAVAGEHYRQAAELAPDSGETLNNYGAWLCANGAAAESLVWFDRALAVPDYPSPASALANAGGCALQVGQRERGLRDLRKALAMEPNNPYALEAMAREELAQGHFFEARAFAERRIAAAPANSSVLQLAVKIEQGLGDKAASSRYRQRLRKEFPNAATTISGNNP